MRIYAKPYDDIKAPFTIDENGAFAEFIIQKPEELHEDLVLGSTVLVFDLKTGNSSDKAMPFWIAGRIVGMKAISPFNPERENMLYQEDETESPYNVLEEIPGGPHHHQPMVLRIELDFEMDVNTPESTEVDYFISPIQRPPSSFSRMFIPEIEKGLEIREPSLKQILNLKNKGVLLGCVGSGNSPFVKTDQFLFYKLDVFNLENKHMFIVGESGSGKTVFLKNLAYELRTLEQDGMSVNNRIIMLDVQGDIVQLLFPNLDDDVTLKPKIAWQKIANATSCRSNVTKDYIDEKLKPFRLILPKSKRSKRTKNASALKLLCEKNNIDVIEAGLRLQDLNLPSEVEYLMRINSQQAVTILDQYAEAFRNSNKTIISIQNIRNAINTTLQQHKGQDTIPSKTTGTSYYRSSFDAAKRALDALEAYFDLDEEIVKSGRNPLDNLKEPGTTIIYLADLNQEERLMWEMLIVKWLNDNNDTINEEESTAETYVFIDEAHQIIPARPLGIADKDTFDRLRSNFERLAREGRKFGINLILSTQSPKDLHEIVPDQCPNKVVMKINPRNAEYAYLDKELALIASRFNYGQFWFQSPFNDTPHWLRLHSLATPLPHEPVKTFFPKIRKITKKITTGQ